MVISMDTEATNSGAAPRDLKQAIYEFVHLVDPYLAASETPVSMRAFRAAAMFVKTLLLTLAQRRTRRSSRMATR
jgi:hypothetical protein